MVRPAGLDDCRRFWEWRNHPSARAVAFDQRPIPYESHVTWFTRMLDDPATRMLVVLDPGGRAIGYVRCDAADGDGEISVALDDAEQGKGYGPPALRAAAERFLEAPALRRLRAHVRPGNERSLRAFERAGFVRQPSPVAMHGESVHELILERPA